MLILKSNKLKKASGSVIKREKNKVGIIPPLNNEIDIEKERREVRKYARLIPTEPEPNLGRVYEIKKQIKDGTYLTQEMIDEVAHHLAIRFLKKDI